MLYRHPHYNHQAGFTLIEVLIALFIFTLLSMMLLGGLRSVLTAHSGTEVSAARLRELQIALLLASRDIEQTVMRPALNADGKEDNAFVGRPTSFTFTHTGFALERTEYTWHDESFWRVTWPAVDVATATSGHARRLLTQVEQAAFQYLDKDGKFHDAWPLSGQNRQPLPRAVRVSLTISHWGEISQLYVISAQPSQTTQPNP